MDLSAHKLISVPPARLVFTYLNNHFLDNRLQEFTYLCGVGPPARLTQASYRLDDALNLLLEFNKDEPLGFLRSVQLAFKLATFVL